MKVGFTLLRKLGPPRESDHTGLLNLLPCRHACTLLKGHRDSPTVGLHKGQLGPPEDPGSAPLHG